MAQRGAADVPGPCDGEVDVACAILLVGDVPLGLEVAKHATHGGVTYLFRQRLLHFCGRCATGLVQDIHDLPLAAAELVERMTIGHGGPPDVNVLTLCQYIDTMAGV